MSKKCMLINATDPEEIRVATLVDGVLTDFDIEFIHNEKIKGNIYRAKVVRVDHSLQAAFIHYGGQKNDFLPIGEITIYASVEKHPDVSHERQVMILLLPSEY